ncbi:transcription factor MYB24-like [Prunus yedoensis var. nudiflora]|uniref:Transcription factor MYB24-like n=1 Tax=Prunus yedoensis var. nudiflora TaxID=2094558 RepID=A0A314UDY8_PRUYE|nr:transcription factor MYB24-like [Prunus yedoensis var. nudiflora]PQQ10293.1 transcription factor MYB24-like [Prunus yedoensis var. nudiflora]
MTIKCHAYGSQVKQDMETTSTYPHHTTNHQEQGFYYSMLNGNVSMPEASNNENNFSWDGLWNSNDVHGNFSSTCAIGKAS